MLLDGLEFVHDPADKAVASKYPIGEEFIATGRDYVTRTRIVGYCYNLWERLLIVTEDGNYWPRQLRKPTKGA